jgi:hypothetical protein
VWTYSGNVFFEQVLGIYIGFGVLWAWGFGTEPKTLQSFTPSVGANDPTQLGTHPGRRSDTIPGFARYLRPFQFASQLGVLFGREQARSTGMTAPFIADSLLALRVVR